MTEHWIERVESERDALEDLAESDLPCADVAQALLDAVDETREVATP